VRESSTLFSYALPDSLNDLLSFRFGFFVTTQKPQFAHEATADRVSPLAAGNPNLFRVCWFVVNQGENFTVLAFAASP
jgi:hypothetical protein